MAHQHGLRRRDPGGPARRARRPSGGASGTTVHGAVGPENQATSWSVEYGPTERVRRGHDARGSLPGDSGLHQVSADLPGLQAGRLYHYRLVADNPTGSTSGEDRVFVAGSSPGSDAYRDAVLATAGVAGYWRLGELSGEQLERRDDRRDRLVRRALRAGPAWRPRSAREHVSELRRRQRRAGDARLARLARTRRSRAGSAGAPARRCCATAPSWAARAGCSPSRAAASWLPPRRPGLQHGAADRDRARRRVAPHRRDEAAALRRRCTWTASCPFVGHRGRVAAGGGAVARDEERDQRRSSPAERRTRWRSTAARSRRAEVRRATSTWRSALAGAPLPAEPPPPAAEPPLAGTGPGGGVLGRGRPASRTRGRPEWCLCGAAR